MADCLQTTISNATSKNSSVRIFEYNLIIVSAVWYKTKFGSQNFWLPNWGSFLLYIYNVKKYVQYESNDDVIKYYGSVIPHDWDVSFEKIGGLRTVVAFWEN